MAIQTSLVLTYKGKVLLFSYDVSFDKTDNVWDFLKLGKKSEKNIITYLKDELNIPVDSDQALDIISDAVDTPAGTIKLLHLKLTDKNVNGLTRKDGWRLEFYRYNEIEKITLSDEAAKIFATHNETIKNLLAN